MAFKCKVSVLIPTYNYAHYLDETIQSVLAQTFTDFELIIVDNCSTDNTAQVVQPYLSDSRVIYHQNEKNLGLVGNWNKCLELAQGEYIKFLCADDKFYPQLLERFVPVLDQNPGLAIVSSYDEIFGTKSFCRISPFKGWVSGQEVRKDLLGPRNRLRNPSCVMFRSSHARQVGFFNTKMHQLTDREYYLRLLNLGDCYVIPEVLSYVRDHEGSQSTLVRRKTVEPVFERYWFMRSVAKYTLPHSEPGKKEINADIRKRAIRSAAVMYQLLPMLHQSKMRQNFKKAFDIGRTEGVLFTPVLYYLKWKYIKKALGK